ncbi:hypothetical protein L9F63_006433 [Diploptera punctata]|uniref:C3H1-type domain-containing protein n=1 Tax=Diploptera punctata TaxID=6984 RepID=A0AAD7ZAM3_DIPPU|nr:hypothetical protein L9F63_006433 [Diploptera punctata]
MENLKLKHEIAAQARRDDEASVAVSATSERDDGSGDESGETVDDRDSSPIRSPKEDSRECSPIRSPREDGRDCSPERSPRDDNRESSPIHSSPPFDRDSSPVRLSPPVDREASPIRSPPPENTDSDPVRSEPPTDKKDLSSSPKFNNDISGSESDDISSASSIVSDGRPPSPREPPILEDGEASNSENKDKEETGPCSPVESEQVSDKLAKKDEIPGHGEDLSDVSDLDSNDGRDSLDGVSEEDGRKKTKPVQGEWKGGVNTAPVEEMEQLDFEAEDQADKEEKEEGECEGGGDKSEDDGELKGDDLEEGELTDEDENRPEETEPRPVCRFYNRGQCTWGSSCRFVHPGVTDKGNYTMFDMVRPLVPVNGPPIYPPVDYRAPYEKPVSVTTTYQGPRKEETPVFESAWERGLRQAKEMMRKSSKRKETDMDFEEKKMNLSLGQEELDKENDYYTRPASPILKDESDRWGLKLMEDGKYHHEDSLLADRYDEYPDSPSAYYHQSRSGGGGDYWRRVHYEPGDSRAMRIETDYGGSTRKYHSHQHRPPPAEYYEKKKKSSHPAREVIVQRTEKPWRDERYAEVSVPSHRGRGDEWADPWMRSKSPSARKTGSRPSRRQSYSSGSTYSTSSSSRSSSQSSYSSYSHDSRSRSRSKSLSRSRSRSSSRTPLSRSRRKPNRPLAISPRKISKQQPEPRAFSKASLIQSEKKAASERALLMNPPAPSPRKQKEVRPPSPGMMRKSAQNPPPPSNSRAKLNLERSKAAAVAAAVAVGLSSKTKMRSQSKSSKSSSGSDSSGSSSDSSESTYSTSSSSREPSPKTYVGIQDVRPLKRIEMDARERLSLAQSLKVKAMDALKLSGQKQQIKLTLKAPERVPPTLIAGKKRPAEEPLTMDPSLANKIPAIAKPVPKKATSRREELLKQLKAVEDAIARKRSKI